MTQSTNDNNRKKSGISFQYGALVDPAPCLALLQKWNSDLIGFYMGRLQQYTLLPQKIAGCRSTEELVEVQLEFYRQLVEDYRTEADKLSEITDQQIETLDAHEVAGYAAKILKAQEDARQIIKLANMQAERIIADAQQAAAELKSEKPTRTGKAA